MSQILFTNATLACLDTESGYGLHENAALLVEDDRIRWLGAAEACPVGRVDESVDCGQRLLTPGLIDCHTHLVYAGDRSAEFEQRLEGASYAEIAAGGGGILSTVTATRNASETELVDSSRPRLQALLREGVTTVEIKSGYGLDHDTEIRMLLAARTLAEEFGINLQNTYLGAHALPPEYHDRADDYIDLVCDEILPAAHSLGLVDAVDVFVESIAFTQDQGERVLRCARRLGLPVKAHAEQLSNMGGATMAAALGALSVDHLEYLPAADVAAIADRDTVAVLLPGAFYMLREQQLPPIDTLREHGVPLALATDANPGSSPIHSLQLIMNMACTLFALTPAEALRGVTINAARALGMDASLGSLEVGKQADIVLWDLTSPAMLSYRVGINPCHAVLQRGRWRQPPRREAA